MLHLEALKAFDMELRFVVFQTVVDKGMLCCRGVHIMVCTPGRLIDMLDKKMVRLDVCR